MRDSQIIPLPYCPSSLAWMQALQVYPHAVFLDSGSRQNQHGRYDILTAAPYQILTEQDGEYQMLHANHKKEKVQQPLQRLRQELRRFSDPNQEWPCVGGALGYFGYDFSAQLQRIRLKPSLANDLPSLHLAFYSWVVVVDHLQQRAALIYPTQSDPCTLAAEEILARLTQAEAPEIKPLKRGNIQSNMSRSDYDTAVARILCYIHAGDCYQVNFSQQFSQPVQANAWQTYLNLRHKTPEPFSAYLDLGDSAVLSFSPERFLRVEADQISTDPIKGTRPRAIDSAEDQRLQQELLCSTKDRAENIMIVDLLRNDLGRVCQTGSVKTTSLCQLQSFSKLHHLVSSITGKMKRECDRIDLLQSCLPGGSVTGAPKIRVMQIIDELEPHRRGVYCGSIGYLSFNGQMDTNIAIRTAVHHQGQLSFCAGGGIVADSNAQSEFDESLSKAAVLF